MVLGSGAHGSSRLYLRIPQKQDVSSFATWQSTHEGAKQLDREDIAILAGEICNFQRDEVVLRPGLCALRLPGRGSCDGDDVDFIIEVIGQ